MSIYEEIKKEREYQDRKWGHHADDNLNTPWMWVSYIGHYATTWMAGTFSLNSSMTDNFRTAMVKVAAIAVAAIESIDRQRAQNGKTFYEVK
jgi:hypothetical protein